jgi:uncharacterized membrane protein YGL010W
MMNEDDRLTLEMRLERLERQVAELAAAMREPPRRGHDWAAEIPRPRASANRSAQAAFSTRYESFLASRSIEWWLARGGAVLTCLALVLLYQYAVERNWITPLVRVAAGILVGVGLFYSASRIPRGDERGADDIIGLREVLLGAGLAAWYITAYAAAIYYGLIPVGTARFLFLLLTAGGVWLALREQRSVLGFLALGTGFLTPLFLPSSNPYIPLAATYLVALAALGIIVYLMRGWQSILWLTFAGFWWTASQMTELVCCDTVSPLRITGSISAARIAMTIVIIVAGAMLVRTPLLRRRLVASGSPLYSQPRHSGFSASIESRIAAKVGAVTGVDAQHDSLALWLITIASPLLSVLFLSWIWTAVQGTAWGIVSLALAIVAYRLASSSRDEEFSHVEAAATTIWSLAGVLWLADSIGSRFSISSELMLSSAALHAVVTLYYLRNTRFVAPNKIAIATASVCIATVLLSETMFRNFAVPGFDTGWTIAEAIVIAAVGWIWWMRRSPGAPLAAATLLGLSAYVSLMFIDARILNRIWPPLITATFAVAGAALVMLGRKHAEAQTLRRLGGFTLVVVVARLFMFDLARVETIWRVLLFLGCGGLFLFTSHRLQDRPGATSAEPRA